MSLRVLVAGHSLVNPLNRARVEALARLPDLELAVLVPDRWTGSHGEEYDLTAVPPPDGYRLLPHPVWFRGANQQHLFWYSAGLTRRIREVAPQLLHVEEEPYSLATFQLACAAGRDLPLVLTSFQNLEKRHPVPFRWTERFVLSRARAALAGTPATERVLRAKGFTGRIAPVALGIDPALYRPGRDEELARSLGLTGFVAGFVGRLVAMKGVDLLLRAVARLPTCRLVVVGQGPDEARLRALADELSIAGRVTWVATVPHADVPRYLGLMDALVLPSITTSSIQEQFGRVLVEAMASEVAVIGSNSGGIPGVIGEAGLVFPEGDSVLLSARLMELARSPARKAALARAGRERALSLYTWEAIARGIAALYREVSGT